jgi:hypothetical protein
MIERAPRKNLRRRLCVGAAALLVACTSCSSGEVVPPMQQIEDDGNTVFPIPDPDSELLPDQTSQVDVARYLESLEKGSVRGVRENSYEGYVDVVLGGNLSMSIEVDDHGLKPDATGGQQLRAACLKVGGNVLNLSADQSPSTRSGPACVISSQQAG